VDITESLKGIIKDSPTAPFLFIGSGFSRRYLGLEDWEGLLTRFGNNLPTGFVKYASESNDNLALAAQNMASAYSEYWWKLSQAKEISKSPKWYKHLTAPLRYDICEYLKNIPLDVKSLQAELEILTSEKTVIDGVITTNWDLLLENLFPTYKVYVGQSNLLFSNPQKIAEIYKIHGCSSDPKSLVLTQDDYDEFKNKNAYLASKLLSVFLEHPVFFMGYSLNDENIASILGSISEIMTTDEQREKIAKNLIFVNRAKGSDDSISETQLRFLENKSIPITQVKTDDFSKIYLAFQGKERKIPAHILRIFREQFYQIVQGESPEKKLYCPTDIDEIIKSGGDIEFVAGFGVAQKSYLGEVGLRKVSLTMVLRDLIFDDLGVDPNNMMDCLSNLSDEATYLPVQKYVVRQQIGISDLKAKNLYKFYSRTAKFFKDKISNSYKKTYSNKHYVSIDHILDDKNYLMIGKIHFLSLFVLDNPTEKNLKELNTYLEKNFDEYICKTEFKKLICIYDLLKYKVK